MIFVDVFWIAAVMNAVMRWRVQNPLQRPHLANKSRVNPELIQRIKGRDRNERGRVKAQERQRDVKRPRNESLKPTLPQRHR